MARKLLDLAVQTDVRDMLSAIRVPTLVMHRREDIVGSTERAADLGDRRWRRLLDDDKCRSSPGH